MLAINERNDVLTEAVRASLAAMESDPFDPRRGTKTFASPQLGQVRATQVRGASGWWILWMLGEGPGTIEVVALAEPDMP